MPRLNIPAYSDDHCDLLQISVVEVLNADAFAEVRALLDAAGDPSRAFRARTTRIRREPDVTPVLLRESLIVHRLLPEEAREESEAMRDIDPEYPAPDEIAAHLHLQLTFEMALETDAEEDSRPGTIDRTVEWLRQRRPTSQGTVSGGRTFPSGDYRPLVPMPQAAVPFTAVRALTLIRETGEPGPRSRVYEVTVREWDEFITASVHYQTQIFLAADAVEKTLESASEIAGFGVCRKLTDE